MITKPTFEICDDVPPPVKAAGGRPRDLRIAEICERAATAIACGRCIDVRQAANMFTPEYGGKAYDPNDRIRHNELANDLRQMIERHITEFSERNT